MWVCEQSNTGCHDKKFPKLSVEKPLIDKY